MTLEELRSNVEYFKDWLSAPPGTPLDGQRVAQTLAAVGGWMANEIERPDKEASDVDG